MTEEYFYKSKKNKDGFYLWCKECFKKKKKESKESGIFKRRKLPYEKNHRNNNDVLEKKCGECGVWFPKNSQYFYERKEGADGFRDTCKECRVKYRYKNAERIKQYETEHKKERKTAKLKRDYNLSLNEYNIMLEKQNNNCCICGEILKLGSGGCAIDHCHLNNKIRGIVCQPCNVTMGLLKENIDTLKSMITYLEKHATS